jgi:hypothetical protein
MAMKKKKSIIKTKPVSTKEIPGPKNPDDSRKNPSGSPNLIMGGIGRSLGKMAQRTRNFLLGSTNGAGA